MQKKKKKKIMGCPGSEQLEKEVGKEPNFTGYKKKNWKPIWVLGWHLDDRVLQHDFQLHS